MGSVAFYEGPGVTVTALSSSRRYGRRFVHVSIDVGDRTRAPAAGAVRVVDLSICTRRRHVRVQAASRRAGGKARRATSAGTATELVAFRMHLPSRITYHNAPSHRTERGNILEWEQTLADRLRGTPIDIDVQMETQSILARTLLLFGTTIVAAFVTLAVVIWWVARRGHAAAEPCGRRPPAPCLRPVRVSRAPARPRRRSSDRSSPRRRRTSWQSTARASGRYCC